MWEERMGGRARIGSGGGEEVCRDGWGRGDGAMRGSAQHGEMGQDGPRGGRYLHVDRERSSSVQTERAAVQVTGHGKAIL